MFNDIYRGKRVLVTGHSGFKGSWLTMWLGRLGAELCGVSLPPETEPNHFRLLNPPGPFGVVRHPRRGKTRLRSS